MEPHIASRKVNFLYALLLITAAGSTLYFSINNEAAQIQTNDLPVAQKVAVKTPAPATTPIAEQHN